MLLQEGAERESTEVTKQTRIGLELGNRVQPISQVSLLEEVIPIVTEQGIYGESNTG